MTKNHTRVDRPLVASAAALCSLGGGAVGLARAVLTRRPVARTAMGGAVAGMYLAGTFAALYTVPTVVDGSRVPTVRPVVKSALCGAASAVLVGGFFMRNRGRVPMGVRPLALASVGATTGALGKVLYEQYYVEWHSGVVYRNTLQRMEEEKRRAR